MTKVTKALIGLSLTTFLGFTNPVVAQADNATTTTRTVDTEHDNSGKWGLLGLTGLLGLLGLRKRESDNHRTHSTVNR